MRPERLALNQGEHHLLERTARGPAHCAEGLDGGPLAIDYVALESVAGELLRPALMSLGAVRDRIHQICRAAEVARATLERIAPRGINRPTVIHTAVAPDAVVVLEGEADWVDVNRVTRLAAGG